MKVRRRLFLGLGTFGASLSLGSIVRANSYPPGDIRRHGAVTGSDISAALRDAIYEVQGTPDFVLIPSGVWLFSISREILLTADLSIRGEAGAVIEFDKAKLEVKSAFVSSVTLTSA